MWPETLTACVCEQAGWCQRHGCFKPEPLHLLCRRQERYFHAWEEGRGPCLQMPGAAASETPAVAIEGAPTEGPSLLRRAMNFGQAVVGHAADGFHNVDDATFEGRLALCRECASCDTVNMICREPQCGCFLNVKARWRSQVCPLGRWPQVEEVQP